MTSARAARSVPAKALALAAGLAAGVAAVPAAQAQGVALQVGHLFDDGGWTAYSAGWTHSLTGSIGAQLGGVYLRRPGSTARLFGATFDAALFRGGRSGAYAIAGLGAGVGTGSAESWWHSWSAGLGYELFPLPFLSVAAEGRYREMRPSARSGPELAIRIGTVFGPRGVPAPLPVTAGTPGAGAAVEPRTGDTRADSTSSRAEAAPGDTPSRVPLSAAASRDVVVHRSDADAVALEVIRIAEGEVGTRYQLGGTGGAGDGFDCSGLIQYAFARYGIELPRRSVDQARRGREVGTRITQLRAGDILTFSTSGGGRVTHVGLYMGDGRFIHSASKGVQISRLSREDPQGRYWVRRWVGSRRILEPDGET
jgi:cell wall-associated NlpC family hydrolase